MRTLITSLVNVVDMLCFLSGIVMDPYFQAFFEINRESLDWMCRLPIKLVETILEPLISRFTTYSDISSHNFLGKLFRAIFKSNTESF